MRSISMRVLTIVCALSLILGSCTPISQKDGERDEGRTRVKIDNRNVMSMTIFVVRRGQEFRIGFVPGQSKETLTIPNDLIPVPTTLQLLANPVGSNASPISREFFVSPGDTIEMVIRSF
jgi:hypothetical protein